ncbi:MAG: hypothetical protein M1159_04825 [Candidatus Thermoplasmatota archaeon]|nr:hypothetical protein [Candidatus Thermoplasmatota archaeon]
MKKINVFQFSLTLSILLIIIGTADLRMFALVPLYLTYLSILAIVIGLIDLYYVFQDVAIAVKIGVLLAIAAILSSLEPAHFSAILQFGKSLSLSIADISLIFGFIVFPLVYIISYFHSYSLKEK